MLERLESEVDLGSLAAGPVTVRRSRPTFAEVPPTAY